MRKWQRAANDEKISDGDARETSEVLVKSKTLIRAGRHHILARLDGVSAWHSNLLKLVRTSANSGAKECIAIVAYE